MPYNRYNFFYRCPSITCIPFFKYPKKYTPPLLNNINTKNTFIYV